MRGAEARSDLLTETRDGYARFLDTVFVSAWYVASFGHSSRLTRSMSVAEKNALLLTIKVML